MKFAEKLARLCDGLNKAKVSRDAGLPPNAVSDYINKGYLPRVDTALSLARVLNVSLDWLADDIQTWPQPSDSAANPALISDTELMLEVARRMRRKQIDLLEQIEAIEAIDWKDAARTGEKLKDDEPIPPDLLRLLWQLYYLRSTLDGTLQLYDSVFFADVLAHPSRLPGADRAKIEFKPERLTQRVDKIISDPAVKAAFDVFAPRMEKQLRTSKEDFAKMFRSWVERHSSPQTPPAPSSPMPVGGGVNIADHGNVSGNLTGSKDHINLVGKPIGKMHTPPEGLTIAGKLNTSSGEINSGGNLLTPPKKNQPSKPHRTRRK